MPATRNLRHSGRLDKAIPVIYDKDGWGNPQSVTSLAHHNIKVEPADVQVPPVPPPSVSPPTSSPSHPSQPQANRPPSARRTAPTRQNSHTRRRDPTHVPRPRNAFILFRSAYVVSAAAANEGQQNELSRQAGKAWEKLSDAEKEPYRDLAVREKEAHREKYPNYVYAPGGRAGTKGKAKAGASGTAASGRRRSGTGMPAARAAVQRQYQQQERRAAEQWSRSSVTSSSAPGSPESVYSEPPPRAPRIIRLAAQRAAAQFVVRSPSPSPSPSPRLTPTADERQAFAPSPHSPSPFVDDDFVPTSEIPVLELTPLAIKEEEEEREEDEDEEKREEEKEEAVIEVIMKDPEPAPESKPEHGPKFEPAPYYPHLDRPQGPFAFKPYITPAAMCASLPPLPRTAAASPSPFDFDMDESETGTSVPSVPIPIPIAPLRLVPLLPHPDSLYSGFPFSLYTSAIASSAPSSLCPPVEQLSYAFGGTATALTYSPDHVMTPSTLEPASHEEWCRYQLSLQPKYTLQDELAAMEEYFDFGE